MVGFDRAESPVASEDNSEVEEVKARKTSRRENARKRKREEPDLADFVVLDDVFGSMPSSDDNDSELAPKRKNRTKCDK